MLHCPLFTTHTAPHHPSSTFALPPNSANPPQLPPFPCPSSHACLSNHLMQVQLTNQSPLASRMTPLLVLGRSLVPSLLLFFGQCQSCYRFCPFGWPKFGG